MKVGFFIVAVVASIAFFLIMDAGLMKAQGLSLFFHH